MDLVIDTNILFSALLKPDSNELKIVTSGKHEIYACQYSVVELFKHKEKLLKLSGLQEEKLIEIYYLLGSYGFSMDRGLIYHNKKV